MLLCTHMRGDIAETRFTYLWKTGGEKTFNDSRVFDTVNSVEEI